MTVDKKLILQLYKDFYKYGKQLKYTDKEYFYRQIRAQFENNNQSDLSYKKGLEFLKKKRII